MKPTAIVYTSNTGHTRQYALLLGEAIGIPAYSLREAKELLPTGRPVIYMGWLRGLRRRAVRHGHAQGRGARRHRDPRGHPAVHAAGRHRPRQPQGHG